MPSANFVRARVLERIARSEHMLTVHYPPGRPVLTGTAPGAAPVSPLTGPAQVLEVFASDPTPAQASVTVKCLWLDTWSVMGGAQNGRIDAQLVGWVQGAEAMARLALSDVILDAQDPQGDTIFTAADYVEKDGHRFKILSCKPIGNGFTQPYSVYVWLHGAQKQ